MAKALKDITVLDCATLFAGPYAATMLGDYGADVIKIEHPEKPDPSRGHGAVKDGHGLWWKSLGRNKRTITADLKSDAGRALLLRLVENADVLIENFRPGTLERWGLGWDELSRANPRLILVRVTGFGQLGPRKGDAGFGTLAEAMSGFAAMTGQPDGPPTLPPLALADGVAGLTAAYATMVALHAREHTGRGQVVDLALIEPLLGILGPQITAYDQLGEIPERTGNRTNNNAPRNTYLTSDGRWLAISTSSQSIAERVMRLVGRPEYIDEPWFATGRQRAQHADELDAAVTAWVSERTAEQALAEFSEAEAAACLIYDVSDIVVDEQYAALGTIQTVADPELGPLKMTNVLFRMSETPGEIRFSGRRHGADTAEILREAGYSEQEAAELLETGGIR
ncbi:crotonobetainyl-CoA:carnitine CoA-transferase CaiB-like acyl-CoA transferase [Homoserinimonas aerilata]|uniref:Crotonobetainyl-CoA:carnitine CoA-transferase CaiB-like acyl-CoA transferase n=1 Tax=Homoserinimonas aerilata TaxID=1162970 RepID=A0A542YAB5_9MICO|nr:CoA transferase [Homoserinimonas aerilata]TQL45027.1 crotonobetainyl-CoA:carnitine CoA-transferase CaiB-like acyl-CoA transferase [Homoserinimonas aerilata]